MNFFPINFHAGEYWENSLGRFSPTHAEGRLLPGFNRSKQLLTNGYDDRLFRARPIRKACVRNKG
jgi:hypothetical protein